MQRVEKKCRSVALAPTSLFYLKLEHALSDSVIRAAMARRMVPLDSIEQAQVSKVIGQHLLAEFSVQCADELTPGLLRKTLLFAAQKVNATILTSHFFETENGGVSGAVVIAESHFIVHYFPGNQYLALDIYTCGEMDTQAALDYIVAALQLKPYDDFNFKRGIIQSGHAASLGDAKMLPGIAMKQNTTYRFFNDSSVKNQESIARHAVGEFYCSQASMINNGENILDAFREAFRRPQFKFEFIREFKPQGVSVVVMGDGFHATTHTWPELAENYAPVDIFISDGANIDLAKAMKSLAELFHSERFTTNLFTRGVMGSEQDFVPVFERSKASI